MINFASRKRTKQFRSIALKSILLKNLKHGVERSLKNGFEEIKASTGFVQDQQALNSYKNLEVLAKLFLR